MKLYSKTLAIALIAGTTLLANSIQAAPQTKTATHAAFRYDNKEGDKQRDDKKRGKENTDEKDIKSFRVLLQPTKNAEAIRMFVEKESGKRLTIRLKTPDGYPLVHFLTDKKPESIYRKFNFIDAEEGTYTFEISDGKQTITKKIVLQRTKPEVQTKLAVE
ncbi:MAG: hypothetical protein ACTHLE_15645 [Agriterribacter sp.]